MSTGVPGSLPSADGPRWRVEELARRADVSVDTIRFYQKRRLLAAPRARAASPGTAPTTRAPGPHPGAPARGLLARGDPPPPRRRARRGRRSRSPRRSPDADTERRRPPRRSTTSPRASGVPVPLLEAVVARGPARPPRHDGEARLHRGRRRGGPRRPVAARGRVPAPRPARARPPPPRRDAATSRTTRSRCSTSTSAVRCQQPTSPTTSAPSGSSTRSARCSPPPPRSSRTTSAACCSRSRRSTSRRSATERSCGRAPSRPGRAASRPEPPCSGRDGALPAGRREARAVEAMFDRLAPRYDR